MQNQLKGAKFVSLMDHAGVLLMTHGHDFDALSSKEAFVPCV